MELKQYIAPLLRWWWLIVLAVILSAGSSFYIVRQQPDTYSAITTLAVGQIINNPNPNSAQISLSQQLAATYADLAGRETVSNAARQTLGLNRLPAYRVSLAAQNRLLIEISVTDTDPVRAAAVANTLAEELIKQSPTGPLQQEQEERRVFVNERLSAIQTQIQETQDELDRKEEEFALAISALEIQTLRQDINALQAKLTQLESNYANLLAGIETSSANTIEILIPATVPDRPVGPRSELTVILASLIGAILAGGAAYLLSYLDDTIKTPEDVARVVNLPTLAGIARVKKPEDQVITLKQPRSPTAEAFRGLRTAAQFAAVDTAEASFMITSPNPNEGKSTIAANLAVAMGQAGYRTLLIDADLRRPSVHAVFGLPNNHGLTDLLLELKPSRETMDAQLDRLLPAYVLTSEAENLALLTSGPLPPNPSELLGSVKMSHLIEALNKRYDYLIFDSAPTLAVTDSVVLSAKVSGVILVVEVGRTRRPHLKQVAAHLRNVNGNVLGVVLNRISARSGDYYYYYRYQDSYYNKADAARAEQQYVNGNAAEKSERRGLRRRLRQAIASGDGE